ncbi:MAG TPA: protein-L-isoaspartate(D-aspartate) O-methyltransferase [Candidatus Polarisedimenticolia bacterium]|nr:protein-L-isoaspartate(D-aspartate) O-methyltransferase [Candidatus Polarisedimenticolia bacterium]
MASGAATMAGPDSASDDPTREARLRMVAEQIEARGVRTPEVLRALREVPRHLFVPEESREAAYNDGPLPIGHGQTISQPFVVAFMSEAARVRPGDRVLEVGAGSGYQAAVLAELGAQVFTMEIVPDLLDRARRALAAAGAARVVLRAGDGTHGWPEEAPFDAILATAAPERIPQALLDQLRAGGRLVIPVGAGSQELVRMTRTAQGFEREALLPVRFVPMTGDARRPPS